MKSIYHESTGNTIYVSDNSLFSSSLESRVKEFEALNINSKFEIPNLLKARILVISGHCPIAEEFENDFVSIFSEINKKIKSLNKKKTIKEIDKIKIYKQGYDLALEMGYTNHVALSNTGLVFRHQLDNCYQVLEPVELRKNVYMNGELVSNDTTIDTIIDYMIEQSKNSY